MAVSSSSWLSFPSLLRTLATHARLSVRLLRDPAVPAVFKLLPVVAVLYLLAPVDGMPDFIPILGQLDDVGVLLLALESFLKLCPESVVAHHRAAIGSGRRFSPSTMRQPSPGARAASGPSPAPGPVIDAEFRHDDR